MVEGLSIINYKGKTIVYGNYMTFAEDKSTQKAKTLELEKAVSAEYSKYSTKTLLALTNVQNMYFDMDILNAMKNSMDKVSPYMKKSAIVGVKGLAKAGYNFVIGLANHNTKAFDTEEEAKEWLVKD